MAEEQTETVEVVMGPFADMLKDEQLDHLAEFHGWRPSYSKVTKDELTSIHDSKHRIHDEAVANGSWKAVEGSGRHSAANWYTYSTQEHPASRYTNQMFWLDHRHEALLPENAEDLRQQIEALDLEKPLTASEKKAMLDLVNNDFQTLKREMEVFALDLRAQRKKDAEEESKAMQEGVNDWRARAHKISEEYSAAKRALDEQFVENRRALNAEAKAAGYEIQWDNYGRSNHEVIVTGLQQRLAKIEAETQTEIATAKATLERERLVATRKIMLAGIPKGAVSLVQSIPTAKSLMEKAAANRLASQTQAIEGKSE